MLDVPVLHLLASAVLIVLLMMGAENTRNMLSNLSEKNKYECLYMDVNFQYYRL
jgi:hypothetical protein